MGFFNMMKRAMGFSSAEDDELDVEGIDADDKRGGHPDDAQIV
jgi:hypothetical protein